MSRIWKNSIGFSPKFFSLILAVVFAAGFTWFTDTQTAYAQIAVTKTANVTEAEVGDVVTFTIEIEHINVISGSIELSDVTFPNGIGGGSPMDIDCSRGDQLDNVSSTISNTPIAVIINESITGPITGTETTSYKCSVRAEQVGQMTNVLGIRSNITHGNPITIPLPPIMLAIVRIVPAASNPSIELTKLPARQTIGVGESPVFTFEVQNTGDVDIEEIKISDPSCYPDKDPFIVSVDTLRPDDSAIYAIPLPCEITGTVSFTNTATVTATVVGTGETITDTAQAFVEVLSDPVNICVEGVVINHEEKLVEGVPLYAQYPGIPRIETESDGNGEFTFDISTAGTWEFGLDDDLPIPVLPADWMPVTSGTFSVDLTEELDGCYQIRFKIKQVRNVEVIKVDDFYTRLENWIITASPGPENVFAEPITATTDLNGTAFFTLTEGLWTFTEDVPAGEDITYVPVIPETGIQDLVVDTDHPFINPYTIYFKNRIIETGGCIDIHKRDQTGTPNFADFGIQGWHIEVLRMDGTLAAMGYTDVEGNLKIEDLPSGPYKVVEENRVGWEPVTSAQVKVDIVAGQACQTVTFINKQAPPGFCIEGRKIDINGKFGLPSWEITIKPAVDGGFEHDSDSDFTDGLGQYRFDFPSDDYRIPGSAYEVCEVQQDGWVTAFTPECQIVHLPQNPGACVVVPDFVNAQVGHDLSQYHTPTPYPTEIPTQIPPTATPVPPTPVPPTPVPPTEVPTDTPNQPTVIPSTVTPLSPTYTPIPPTATPIPPTPIVETPTPMPMPSPTAVPTDLPDGHQDGTYGPAGKLPPGSKNDGAAGYSNYDKVYPQGDGPSHTQVESHDSSCQLYHIVHPGEGLSTIAAQYSLYHKDMLRANPWVATQKNGWVYPGQQVCVPTH